ncbi:MAG: type II secretion system protein, partial [Alphaproteobacteria bacterium]|nr:type II secretion system protein [Alphaproteobacteria bacterium]
MKHITQSGRSMVEMLGTLAIMGILSIGGIVGYNYAMSKHRANQVLQDIRLVYQELKYPNTVHQIVSEGSFPDIELDLQSPYEYGFDFANPNDFDYDSTSEKTPNLIYVNVSGVSKTACDILLKTKPEYVLMLKANGQSVWSCDKSENELSYIFEITADSLDYGTCSVCTGEYCFDDKLNCPEGEDCRNDICTKCEEGYVENKQGKCAKCDSFSYTKNVSKDKCYLCDGTIWGDRYNSGFGEHCVK